jgi:hypothetical protein
MRKLVMLAVVLALCVPSFGDILIYNVKVKGDKAAISGTDKASDFSDFLLKSGSSKAYLVVDVNVCDGTVAGACWIPYGKVDKEKIVVTDSSVELYEGIIGQLEGPAKKPDIWTMELFVSNALAEVEWVDIFDSLALGTAKEAKGILHTFEQCNEIASSLRGCVLMENFDISDTNETDLENIGEMALVGSGKITLKLNQSSSKACNNPDDEDCGAVSGGTLEGTCEVLIDDLIAKGYTAVQQGENPFLAPD